MLASRQSVLVAVCALPGSEVFLLPVHFELVAFVSDSLPPWNIPAGPTRQLRMYVAGGQGAGGGEGNSSTDATEDARTQK